MHFYIPKVDFSQFIKLRINFDQKDCSVRKFIWGKEDEGRDENACGSVRELELPSGITIQGHLVSPGSLVNPFIFFYQPQGLSCFATGYTFCIQFKHPKFLAQRKLMQDSATFLYMKQAQTLRRFIHSTNINADYLFYERLCVEY